MAFFRDLHTDTESIGINVAEIRNFAGVLLSVMVFLWLVGFFRFCRSHRASQSEWGGGGAEWEQKKRSTKSKGKVHKENRYPRLNDFL